MEQNTDRVKWDENFIKIGSLRLPLRQTVIEGELFLVPRGVCRNERKNSWQIKISRNRQVIISGSISDMGEKPVTSLAKSIVFIDEELARIESLGSEVKLVHRPKLGRHAEPISLTDRIKLCWKINDATPFMYCSLYSPMLKKARSIMVGSDRKIASNQDHIIQRVSFALAMEQRVINEDSDPFREVTSEEEAQYREKAVELTVLSDEVADFIARGPSLRAKATESRAKANGGLGSELAALALSKARSGTRA